MSDSLPKHIVDRVAELEDRVTKLEHSNPNNKNSSIVKKLNRVIKLVWR